MYKRLITYNFENDETRNSFVEFLEGLGFEEQPDQSTYAQRKRNPRLLAGLENAIAEWSSGKELSANDSAQIYFLFKVSEKQTLIEMHNLSYNARHKDIR